MPFFAWIIIGKVIKLTVWWGSNLIGYQCGVQYPFEGGLGCSILTMMGLNPCANIGIVWYLRALFFLVIVSPLIYNAIKNLGTLFPLAMFCCYGVYGTILYFTNEWDYFVSIRGIAYFTIGVAIRMGLFDGIVAAKRRNCVAMAILCGGGALLLKIIFWRKGMVMIGNFCDSLMVIPLLYAIWTLCTLVRLPNICTRNSFSIYLMHSDFILISIVGFVIAGQRGIMESSLIATVLRWSFAIFASLFFAELVRRSCPRIASFLFGGR